MKNEMNKTEKTERIDRAKRTEKAERIACINCGEVFRCEEDKCPKCGVRFVDFWGVEKRGEKVMMRVRTNVIVGEKEAKATVVIIADKMRVKNMTVDRTEYVGEYAGESVGEGVGESMEVSVEASVEIEGHLLAGEKGDVMGIVRE